jgi:hypothetical protein
VGPVIIQFMHDTGFQIVFWVIFGIVILGFAVTFVGAIAHFAMFGAVLGLIVKRIGSMSHRPAGSHADRQCEHCKSAVSAGRADCPNCGAPMI